MNFTHATVYTKPDGDLHFVGQTQRSMFGDSQMYRVQVLAPQGHKLVGWIKLPKEIVRTA